VLLDIGIDLNNGIHIKNELVDGKVTGNLEIKGDPSKPSILGQINLEKGSRIIVKDTVFDVTTGDIQLDDPKEINPKLYIAANARVQEYNVNLLVQGSTTKTDLNFTSVPPLPKNEIISLLALGSTSTSQGTPSLQSGSGLSSGPKAEVSTGIGKNNPISKEIKAKTGFEVQFAPSFDEQSVTQRIIVKKQFNDKLGVAASQSIGTRRSTDAEARYRLNDRFSGILSWQNRDNLGTLERSTNQREQNQFGLDLEYKFEFK
jgi:translocation and assembly module TamB